MGLPAWLTVEALKLRIDKQLSTDDVLLAEYLEGAFAQAQAPPPYGCGRVLIPDPAPVIAEGEDTSDPVTRTIEVRGRRVLLPDAREVTEVTVDGTAVELGGTAGYHLVARDGLFVRLDLHREYWERSWGGYRHPHQRSIEITGRFGFVKPPVNLIGAIYTLAARRYYEREAQYADAVVVGEGAAAQSYYKQLPPEVRVAFETFALPAGIAGLA